MAECCCPEPTADQGTSDCPICLTASKPVDALTVKAILTVAALQRFEPAEYRFCAAPTCDVVYFSDSGPTFSTGDVRERVWQKEPAGGRTICYCFGENEQAIKAEIQHTGDSAAAKRVREHIAAGRCACEIRNPKGTCCLGDVIAAVERIRKDLKGVPR